DVIVASFPKTGTTWARHIVRHLYYRNDENVMAMTKTMTMPTIYLETGIPIFEASKFELLEKLPWKKRVMATHVPTQLLDLEKIKSAGAKIIYTIRNPKDQLVSWYHMTNSFPPNPHDIKRQIEMYPKDWNSFFESSKQLLGNKEGEWYMENLLSWYPHRNDENVLFVYFEDLIQDSEKEIKRIADFLGVSVTPEDVSCIANATSFVSMKQQSSSGEQMINFYRKGRNIRLFSLLHVTLLGKVGDWKNHFTVAQSERMDALVKEKLSGTDIQFTYELQRE
uniref:Sulfotransferase n=1 Tax=Ciona intestinalis TaxID=7719 RepID=F6ZNS9_CIOIN